MGDARCCGSLSAWLPLLLAGAAPAAVSALGPELDALLAGLPESTRVGLVVAEAESGRVLFAHQPDAPLKPASVQKLLVTAAALEHFGPDFRFETRVYARGDELWVVGGGDPGFGDERIALRRGRDLDDIFYDWAAAARSHGLTVLSKIVLDDTVFDDELRHPDWPDSQADRWYQAPVGGLNINDNCLDVTVSVRAGKLDLHLRPEVPPSLLDNQLRPGKRQRPVIKRPADSDTIHLSGTIAGGGTLEPVTVRQPTLLFAHALQYALERRGVTVRGAVVRRRLTEADLSTAVLVAMHATSLPDVLWRCNTFSQNLFAECLLKSLAAYDSDGRCNGTAGSWDGGRAVLQRTLAQLGLDISAAEIRDGSGLSHRNRVSAAQLTKLLIRMRRHPHADVFLRSLAEPGELGSMQHRYADPALRGRLRAKTGTLAGVHTLAGYLTRPDGRVWAFTLLINGRSDPALAVRVCRILLASEQQ